MNNEHGNTDDFDEFENEVSSGMEDDALDVVHEQDQDGFTGDDLDLLPEVEELLSDSDDQMEFDDDILEQESAPGSANDSEVSAKEPSKLPFIAAAAVLAVAGGYFIFGDSTSGSSATAPQQQALAPVKAQLRPIDAAPQQAPSQKIQLQSLDSQAFPVEPTPASDVAQVNPVTPPPKLSPVQDARVFEAPAAADGVVVDATVLRSVIGDALAGALADHRGKLLSEWKREFDARVPVAKGEDYNRLIDKIDSLGLLVESSKGEPQQNVAHARSAFSDADIASLARGRERLKGFKVVNVTDDGKMSVVKTPSGRTQVYFSGEKLYLGGNIQEVTGIKAAGSLVLVGSQYFIDHQYVPAAKVIARAPAAKRAPPQVIAAKPKRAEKLFSKIEAVPVISPGSIVSPVSEPARVEPIASDTVQSSATASGVHVVASAQAQSVPLQVQAPTDGWSFHAIMNNGYLLHGPDDKWPIFSNGDLIPGLGQVAGIDERNNLKVGRYIIPLSR